MKKKITDTEMLDWVAENLDRVYQDTGDYFHIEWWDEKGNMRSTQGESLRECIRIAMTKPKDMKLSPISDHPLYPKGYIR